MFPRDDDDPTTHGGSETLRRDALLGRSDVARDAGRLDTFEAPAGHRATTYQSDEVTAVCPVTGQPDWYVVTITVHGEHLIESKSLKLYLQSFRDSGMFAEAFAARIAHDVQKAAQAEAVEVTVTQKPRGGVTITTTSEVHA